MTSRKTPVTKKTTKTSSKKNRADSGILKIDSDVRLNLLHLDAEVRAARNQFTMEQMKLGQYIQSIDKDGIIMKSQAALQATAQNMQVMEARYSNLRNEVEAKLGINLREYSFDDETGVLHKHPEPVPQPVAQEAKSEDLKN